MCENRLDAETRTPFFPAPQNTPEGTTPAQKPSFFTHTADKWALPAALWLGYLYCRMLFGDNDYRWPFHILLGGQDGLWFYCMPLLLCAAFAAAVIRL